MSKPRPRIALTTVGLATAVVSVGLAVPTAQAAVGDPAKNGDLAFTARLNIGNGERACSGALIDPQWVLTAASCFATDPQAGHDIPAGAPTKPTTATIGRTDLNSSAGQVRNVVELVPHADRDMVLARLSGAVTGITPVAFSGTAPAAAESLTVPGYGRTKTEWSPMKLHAGTFTVAAAQTANVDITGTGGNSVCAGDTGGPVLRAKSGGGFELVAVSNKSYQGGCFGTDAAETRTNATASRADNVANWVNSTVNTVPIVDFNGDGARDVAVADSQATIDTRTTAGLVRAVYGGDKGTAEISQVSSGVGGSSETGDQFGDALATVDYDTDGFTDLVVGVPGEDIGDVADAGIVQIVYGSASGLGKGKAGLTLEQGKGDGAIGAVSSEKGDRMGDALAAGTTSAGEPYLVIGVPGEAQGDLAKAGAAFYLRGNINKSIHQDSAGVPGNNEAGDQFGASVAANGSHIAIGQPGEAIGDLADSGAVTLFKHAVSTDGIPTPMIGIDQDSTTPEINGSAEAGDEFGASVSMVDHRPAGASSANESILAIGSPGEDDTSGHADAGRAVTVKIAANGTATQLADIHQDSTDVAGSNEAGDRFGEQVSAVNTNPSSESTAAGMLLAVGVPGENLGTATDSGAVHTFSLLGAPGAADVMVEAGKNGVPGPPGGGQKMGTALNATATDLYIGMPNGPGTYGRAYIVPWDNITGGATGTVTTLEPGKGGLPAAGKAFGSAIR